MWILTDALSRTGFTHPCLRVLLNCRKEKRKASMNTNNLELEPVEVQATGNERVQKLQAVFPTSLGLNEQGCDDGTNCGCGGEHDTGDMGCSGD